MEPADAGRRLRLATGITTSVTEAGPPDARPPVLLLHGWTGSRRSFAALLPLLRPRFRVVAPDLRGHGDADKPATGYDLPALAADVVALLDALGIGRTVLVGASSGGYVAQQVAVAHRDRVAGLVLVGAPRDLRGRPPFADELEQLDDPVDPTWVRRFTAGFAEPGRLPPWYLELMVEDALRLPAAIWRATVDGLVSSCPPADAGVITAPTLVLSGGRDLLLDERRTAALVAAVPGATWIRYPASGHLVLEEEPARVAADVAGFVAALPRG
jgi:pimeloyl-ACP methyl ester carboxylesterase